MKIRVAYLISPTFGSTWSGITQNMFSLISGWYDEEISLDLLGTELKILNSNSGDRAYKTSSPIWQSNHHRMTSFERIIWTLKIIWLLVAQGKNYDIFHFMTINWGGLVSPFVVHPFGKKVVFSMIRYDYDNPSYLLQTPKGRLAVNLLRRFNGIVGVAPAFADDCRLNNFKNKMLILPFFINNPQLEKGKDIEARKALRADLGISKDAPVLLFVGSDHKRKGLDVLIDAFVILSSKHPQLNLVIVGPNNKDDHTSVDIIFLEKQKQKLKQAGVEGNVVWAGMIRDLNLLAKYYSVADILVFPTRGEGFPTVLIDAMFAELPIVVSNLPGITDSTIENGQNGYLVKVNDTQGFIDSMDILINNPDLRESMGKNNHQKAKELFGFEQYCDKLKKFYGEVARL